MKLILLQLFFAVLTEKLFLCVKHTATFIDFIIKRSLILYMKRGRIRKHWGMEQ